MICGRRFRLLHWRGAQRSWIVLEFDRRSGQSAHACKLVADGPATGIEEERAASGSPQLRGTSYGVDSPWMRSTG